ncbi:MAG: prepilin-type N-terminal cleavage/methylation domain-containing protein [Lachnospiraceae bacterium]|nr:prepilin-type N-terminal cleavage/methylation domain-containing protein [Lachnospiraceae bacterium]
MKKNNNGFSLVELIIVIAIMAVLVGVLAPQFIKYVEQSRRSRDITTAQEVREAVLADIADNQISGNGTINPVSGTPTTLAEQPLGSGSIAKGSTFGATYDAVNGTCYVVLSGHTLTTEAGASDYKTATS